MYCFKGSLFGDRWMCPASLILLSSSSSVNGLTLPDWNAMSEAVWWTRWLVFCLFTYVVCIRRIFLRPRKWNGSSFFRKVAARCTVPKLYNKSTTSIWMELESFQKSQPSPLGVLDALRNFTRYVHCVIQIIAQVSCIMSFIEGGSVTKMNNRHVFFVRAHCGSLVLSLTRGPAGERSTTGSQSATSRTARYQLSHEDD